MLYTGLYFHSIVRPWKYFRIQIHRLHFEYIKVPFCSHSLDLVILCILEIFTFRNKIKFKDWCNAEPVATNNYHFVWNPLCNWYYLKYSPLTPVMAKSVWFELQISIQLIVHYKFSSKPCLNAGIIVNSLDLNNISDHGDSTCAIRISSFGAWLRSWDLTTCGRHFGNTTRYSSLICERTIVVTRLLFYKNCECRRQIPKQILRVHQLFQAVEVVPGNTQLIVPR